MAKGSRLATELYFGGARTDGAAMDASDFCEEDVWSTVDANDEGTGGSYGDAEGGEWDLRAAAKARISRRERSVGGLSLAFEESCRTASSRIVHQLSSQDAIVLGGAQTRIQHHIASSAPVNMPEWGKILRVESGWVEDERDSAVDPPHEYLARSRKTAATSVFEGVGRTLKGRDLRRLRDAVWSQTGFDG